jgi:uncharacterized repeat protein (TIGR01451 family)
MNKNKIGSLFLVSVLALAGIGISYAGFTDTIHVSGTAQTAVVEFYDITYTGTHVWKIYDQGLGDYGYEITVTDNLLWTPDVDDGELVSWAKARDPKDDDPETIPSGQFAGEPYDIFVECHNLIPLIPYVADIHFKIRSIPVKIQDITWEVLEGDDWITPLILGQVPGGQFEAIMRVMRDDQLIEVVEGTQIHPGEEVYVELHITIPQDNDFQGKFGSFAARLSIIQWTDECETDVDLSILKTVDDPSPVVGEDITYTITVTNNGPGSATGVVVEDILPVELQYVSSLATQGTYDPTTSLWTVGSLADGNTASLDITATVTSPGSYEGFVELGLILDASGSISNSDWTIMKQGLADAILTNIPDDGSVELTVVQFGSTDNEQVEVYPTIITVDNKNDIANIILAMNKVGIMTNMESGFVLCADTMVASSNHEPSNRQVINLVTDGYPNQGDAIAGRNYLINTLGMTEDQDEIDAEAVGSGADAVYLQNNIVYPQPGNIAPPFIPGWVYLVSSYTEFTSAIGEKFTVIFSSIENCAEIIAPIDSDPTNNKACVTVTPQSCVDPDFTGDWETEFELSDEIYPAEMTLTQVGDSVTGQYSWTMSSEIDGTIEGTVIGRVLTGTSTEDDSDFPIEFTLSCDGDSFEGIWFYKGQDEPEGSWNGVRST